MSFCLILFQMCSIWGWFCQEEDEIYRLTLRVVIKLNKLIKMIQFNFQINFACRKDMNRPPASSFSEGLCVEMGLKINGYNSVLYLPRGWGWGFCGRWARMVQVALLWIHGFVTHGKNFESGEPPVTAPPTISRNSKGAHQVRKLRVSV